jgi:WD40 repeat protein
VCVWDAVPGSEVDLPFRGHSEFVYSVAFSPDGTRIVSASADTTVRIWDAEFGTEVVPPFTGHWNHVISAAFSPDGARIVSGSADNTVRVCDAATGTEITVLQAAKSDQEDQEFTAVAFSPDGTRVVTGSDKSTLSVWDAVSGIEEITIQGHERTITSVAFSPDGTRVVSGSDDETVRIWDVVSGTALMSPFQGHESTVKSVMFSSDGTRIGSTSCNKACAWDVTTGLPYVPAGAQDHDNAFIPSVIMLYEDGWVVDVTQQRTIAKVPGIVVRQCSATSGKSLVIGTGGGHVAILNFPEVLFSGPETRPIEAITSA